LKKFLSINFLIILFFIFVVEVNAVYGSTSDTIRIGLESRYINASSIPISNNSIQVGFDNGMGFVPSANLISYEGFNMIVDNNFYLDTNERFVDYQSAKNRAENLSNGDKNAVVAFLDTNNFAVYFGEFINEEDAIKAFNVIEEAKVVKGVSTNRVTLKDGTNTILVFDNPTKHPQIIDGNNGFITFGDRSYRGVMELGRQLGSGITPVNVVNVEEYLFSVVPSEMPSSWHMEALKAQTVAARSYTFSRRGSHLNLGYELCDTIFSQVYIGVTKESPRTTEAVNATRNIKAFHEGNVIMATYFSSSGGRTENAENVWINAVPYLIGVDDTYEVGGMVWERTFTNEELTNITRSNGINIGNVLSVSILETTPNGRVNSLLITGDNGNHILGGEQIRTFFAPSTEGNLQSRNFTIKDGVSRSVAKDKSVSILNLNGTELRPITSTFVLDSNGNIVHINDINVAIQGANNVSSSQNVIVSTGNAVTFLGRGWGHGVGMSQFGAQGMAEAGYSYKDILHHYYTDIEIR